VLLAFACIGLMQALIVYAIAAIFGGRFHGNLALGGLSLALRVVSYVGLGFFFGTRFARRTQDVNGPVSAFGVLPDFPELGMLAQRLDGIGLRSLAVQRVGLEHVYCELMAA
jgi:hypothetical protein